MNLREITLRPIAAAEEADLQALLDTHHYLGSLPKIGHTLWYVATWRGQWLALLSFCAAAWKCAAHDRWIGWAFRHQYDRLHLIANDARFLILPGQHYRNLASRILLLCEHRVGEDWSERFGHLLLLLETFVDPRYFHGTIYRAANWEYVGDTRGFRRTRTGNSTAGLNDYLNLPHVGQAFAIERRRSEKMTGKVSTEAAPFAPVMVRRTSHVCAASPPA